ncbi:hypothetical protein DL93DRAFT_2084608 [Clavulina sp. PMI_390]|nr:hypothetical protein DL93DRAFT_2084608 [Clavulina sp. PMI_390]
MADDLIEILEDFGLYHSTAAPPTTITHAQTPPPPTTNDSIAHSALDATSSTHVTQSRTDAPQTQPTVSTNSLTTPRQRQVELVTLNGPEGPRQYLRDHSNHLTLVDRDIIIQTAMDCPPVPDELLKELLNNPEFVETCRILSAIVHPS